MHIDAHQHFWQYDPVKDQWITDEMDILKKDFLPEHLWPLLKKNGVDGCVAVQADQSLRETNFLLALCEEHSFIKGVVGWIDLIDKEIDEQLAGLRSYPALKGFRHIVQAEPDGFLRRNDFIDGVRRLGQHNYSYDLLIYPKQMEEALYFVARLEEVRIVVDHMAKPSIRTGSKTRWELQMAALSTFQNVYCKMSGLVTEADWRTWTKEDIFPYLDELMETFGPSRVMYGSDWPVCLLAANYEQQLEIVTDYIGRLSSAEQERIMGGTAVEFYNL